MRSNVVLSIVAAFVLAGCAVGPEYVRPNIDMPKGWRYIESNESSQLRQWWKSFNDPVLNDLVELSLEKNLDIKVATAQIEAAVGQLSVIDSALLPQLGGSGSAVRQKNSELMDGRSQNTKSYTQTNTLSLTVSAFEIDLWGKLKRADEAAKAALLGKQYNRRAVSLAVASGTALAYLQLLILDEQLKIATENGKIQEQITKIVQAKVDNGTTTKLELLQSISALQAAKAAVFPIKSQIAATEHSIALLCAKAPQDIKRTALSSLNDALPTASNLPSTLLSNRPDIMQAEQSLIAANAQIGIARAAYLPSFSLTGALGQQSSQLSSIMQNPAMFWQIIPGLTLPIFSAGRLEGAQMQAVAEYNQSVAIYEKTVLSALKEVEDALALRQKSAQQLYWQKEQFATLNEAVKLSRLQYEKGQISYLPLLTTMQMLLASQERVLQAQSAYFSSYVLLCRALGG